jgi:hypothetical protein
MLALMLLAPTLSFAPVPVSSAPVDTSKTYLLFGTLLLLFLL